MKKGILMENFENFSSEKFCLMSVFKILKIFFPHYYFDSIPDFTCKKISRNRDAGTIIFLMSVF